MPVCKMVGVCVCKNERERVRELFLSLKGGLL